MDFVDPMFDVLKKAVKLNHSLTHFYSLHWAINVFWSWVDFCPIWTRQILPARPDLANAAGILINWGTLCHVFIVNFSLVNLHYESWMQFLTTLWKGLLSWPFIEEHDDIIKWKNFPCYWSSVWRESTSHLWIPLTKASDTELSCFIMK